MKIVLSEPTRKYLLNKYPQLNDDIIKLLMFCGEIKQNSYEIAEHRKFRKIYFDSYLQIPKILAEDLNIENKLDLIPDKDGVIYKIILNNYKTECERRKDMQNFKLDLKVTKQKALVQKVLNFIEEIIESRDVRRTEKEKYDLIKSVIMDAVELEEKFDDYSNIPMKNIHSKEVL